jgi:hypothetical protein
LVNLDPRKGLYESIDLIVRERSYTQVLDYVNIPFCCVHCHRVGHVVKDCSYSFHAKNLNYGQAQGDVSLSSVVSSNLNSMAHQDIPPRSGQVKEDLMLV